MNGAESLVHSLLRSGVDTCFCNPGTSEMHFVAALDRVPGMRCVLGLFEGVVTGAADGYARMAGKPAATLLHCGPGLANGLANLHNARRAQSPIVNIVGDQATYHRPNDAPLTADTEGWARGASAWVRTATSSATVGADAAVAVQAARTHPGQIATLILPSDTSWDEGGVIADALPVPQKPPSDPAQIANAANILRRGQPTLIILGGEAVRAEASGSCPADRRRHRRAADRTGCQCQDRTRPRAGAGGSDPLRGRYRSEGAGRHQARDPVRTAQAGDILCLSQQADHAASGRRRHPRPRPPRPGCGRGARPAGGRPCLRRRSRSRIPVPVPSRRAASSRPRSVAATLAALLPEDAVVTDEAVTFGRGFFPFTYAAAPHDWLNSTGGAIGCGPPLATGAAVGAPGRRVVALQADGSAMYTLQALWTQARERLDVTTVLLSNRKYQILLGELANVGANPGRTALDMLDIGNPDLDWTKLAEGMGVEAARAETCERFADLFAQANARKGPFLIELAI